MIKVVLDTNVWLSALFWEGEANKIIQLCEKGKIKIVITRDILTEMVEVIKREKKFQKFMDDKEENIENLIRTIINTTELVEPRNKINTITKHPQDNIILEAAEEGDANYIISYNKHILDLEKYKDIEILEPEGLLGMF